MTLSPLVKTARHYRGEQSNLATGVEPLTSALGHKRTFHRIRPMSALPPKADIVQQGGKTSIGTNEGNRTG
jgi:hypothetical protein